MPEVADSIGNWMGALETLSNLSVVTNMILLYYTHKNFQILFTLPFGDEPIVNDLKLLEVGIQFKVEDEYEINYGTLTALVDDNLASHQVGGFKSGFANRFRKCRTCLLFRHQ